MKILVVEDSNERIVWFKNRFINDELTIVTTAKDAIDALRGYTNWEYVFLDHDLGGVDFTINGFNEQTGTEVAKFLSAIAFTGKVVIHSMNYYGMKSIKSILPDAVVCSFPILVDQNK